MSFRHPVIIPSLQNKVANMNAYAVTCGNGSTSSGSNRKSKSAPESSCNCCWFIAVLIAANILLDLCCVAIAAYAILNVRDMQLQVSKHMSDSDDMVTAAEDNNATRYQLRILTEKVSVLSVTQANSIMTPGQI